MSSFIGWDIGGAHLKIASLSSTGILEKAEQMPCPLWQGTQVLQALADKVMQDLDENGNHCVTMTGEMADCFISRDDGVSVILEVMEALLQRPFYVCWNDGSLHDVAEARLRTHCVASANWHITASCTAAHCPRGVLVDIGSTTTDIIAFTDGRILAQGRCDSERLAGSELVYTGIVRTPVMAVSREIRIDNRRFPIVAEQFATMGDVYRVLDVLPEHADQHPTCDGGGKTETASSRRLARMFGYDSGNDDLWKMIAQELARQQQATIIQACNHVLLKCGFNQTVPLIGAGIGNFLVEQIAGQQNRPYVCFSELLNMREEATDYASAVSAAWLLRQRCQH